MVAQRFWDFSAIATSPVRIIIALVFLYQYGSSLLTGCYATNLLSGSLVGAHFLEL